MTIKTIYEHAEVGQQVNISNFELMLLRDEIVDINKFFKTRDDLESDDLNKMFSEANTDKINVEDLPELMENFRNVYHFIMKITENVKSSNDHYNSFFELGRDNDVKFDWTSLETEEK